MTGLTFELETISSGLPDETQRYYRMSQSGKSLLQHLESVLGGDTSHLLAIVDEAEKHLDHCARRLQERENWMDD